MCGVGSRGVATYSACRSRATNVSTHLSMTRSGTSNRVQSNTPETRPKPEGSPPQGTDRRGNARPDTRGGLIFLLSLPWVSSHVGPTRHRKRGYLLTTDQSDAHLCERFAVRLDVVSAPQHERDGFGPLAAVLNLLPLQQALHHHARALHGGRGGDCLGVQGVDVLAGGEHVRVPDRVAAGTRQGVVAHQRVLKRAQLVVLNHLRKATLE
eukprot:1176687-Prorocentrum_minimum.AAC.1